MRPNKILLICLCCVFSSITPLPAQTWTATTAPLKSWSSIASSADGQKLAAANGGTAIWTSADAGLSWTSNSIAGAKIVSIASSADGNNLVAAASEGSLYLSSDAGATWANTGVVANYNAVASSADGNRLIAVTGVAAASIRRFGRRRTLG